MNDVITLLATATDDRLERFLGMIDRNFGYDRRKLTLRFAAEEVDLPAITECAVASAVTLQRVIDPGRDERYETLHRGPMEGWGNHARV
jgi:hypothetical protein